MTNGMARARQLLSLAALTACAHHVSTFSARPMTSVSLDAMQADSVANVMIQRAFAADAAGGNADSLYVVDAEIIANGVVREGAPRFAGVGSGGTLELSSSQVRVTGGFVWGTLEYRWLPGSPGQAAIVGRATVVMGQRRDGAWRILHVHSSTAP